VTQEEHDGRTDIDGRGSQAPREADMQDVRADRRHLWRNHLGPWALGAGGLLAALAVARAWGVPRPAAALAAGALIAAATLGTALLMETRAFGRRAFIAAAAIVGYGALAAGAVASGLFSGGASHLSAAVWRQSAGELVVRGSYAWLYIYLVGASPAGRSAWCRSDALLVAVAILVAVAVATPWGA